MAREIAPWLNRAMEGGWCHEADPEALSAELRALIRVAKAARHYRKQIASPLATGREYSSAVSLERALNRLRKLSEEAK